MAKFDDQELALAKVYATAALVLAVEQNQAETLREELADLADYIGKTPDFAGYLSSPTVDEIARKASVEKLFRGRYSDVFVDTLQVLNCNGRLSLLEAVSDCFVGVDDERLKRAKVSVRSAAALSEGARVKIRDLFSKRTGLEVELIETIDASLLGGVVVQIGDEKLDMSVSRQLSVIGEKLLDRASRELHAGRSYVEGGAA